MFKVGVKKTFRTLALIAIWLLLAIFASSLLLNGRAIKREVEYGNNNNTPCVRFVEETVLKSALSINALSPTNARAADPTPRVTVAPSAAPPVTEKTHPSFYHRLYPVNCSAVFEGDKIEIARVNAMLGEEKTNSRIKNSIVVPQDALVTNYTEDCDFYRKARDYPQKVLSEEEKEFPLAFIILTHKNAAQVELLLRAIYHPHNVYAIHPDANSPPDFQRAIRNIARCFNNVFICSRLEKIKYAGFTRLLADINCMHDLFRHPIEWRYVINQAGEAFPLKTNLEMVQQIKAYHGLNDVEGYVAPHKLSRVHKFSSKYHSVSTSQARLERFPPPGKISIYSGNAYNTLSREFVHYVLNDELPQQFLNWINMTYSPDEHYWASLQRVPGAPGSFPNITHQDVLTTFVKWAGVRNRKECIGTIVRGVCIMSTGYLPYLATRPHLFANKFYYTFDPVTIQCLQELLTNRTRRPELTSQYFPEFPVKRDWY